MADATKDNRSKRDIAHGPRNGAGDGTGDPTSNYADRWWKSEGRLTAVGTSVIAAFTVVLAVVGGLQYSVLLQSDETQRVIQSSFVMPRGIDVEGLAKRGPDGVMRWQIIVNWENTGNTATQNLTVYTGWIFHNGAAEPPKDIFPSPNLGRTPQPGDMNIMKRSFPPVEINFAQWPTPPHHTLLGPHQAMYGDSMVLPGPSMERLEDGAASVAVIGIASYHDQFSKKHVTVFCKNLIVPNIDYLQGEPNRSYPTVNPDCTEYNCSDNDCQKYKGAQWLPPDVLP